jgi:hypothetical protein
VITRRSFTAAAIGLNFSNFLPARAQVSGARRPAGTPKGKPIVVAVYYTQSPEPLSSREKVIAEIGRFVSQVFGA